MYEYKKFKVSICEAENFIRKSEQFGWEYIPCKKTIGPLACLNLDKKDDRADTPTICTQNHKSFNATVNRLKADSAALTSRKTDSATARRNFASVGIPDGKTICPDLGTPTAESSDEIRSTAFFSERKHNTIRIPASAKKRYPAKLRRYRQAMQKFDDDCNAVAKRENELIRQARLLDDERRMQNESHTL